MKSRLISPALALLAAIAFPSIQYAADRPNVMIVLVDDMGFSDAGCYGGEIKTPNLDSLARDGLRFTQFYNTARCWPSRAAILTGYYAQEVRRDTVPGVASGGRGVRPPWAALLPAHLKPLGYRSYHSGKWHVDGMPIENGFDRSYLLQDQGRHFNPRVHYEDDQKLPEVEKDSGFYGSIAIADHAIKCLKEHAEKYPDKPFFHYLCFTSPHFPLQALPQDIAKYRDKYDTGWDEVSRLRHERMKEMGIIQHDLPAKERDLGPPYDFPDAIHQLGEGEINRPIPWTELTEAQRKFQAEKMAIHAAMVDRIDQELGRVLDQLRAMGAFENTLILFMSDNGASAEIMIRDDGHDPAAPMGSAASYLCLGPGFSSAANTPLRRHKTWVHEGGISTPLIAHWPKGIPARGELRHSPAHLVDLAPTILELAGDKWPDPLTDKPVPPPPGRSLVGEFAKDGSLQHDYLWWLHEDNRAIRMGDWKLVAAKDDPWELYDLSKDRGESHNLASSMPEKVKEMADLWQKHTDEFFALALKVPPPPEPAKKGGKKAKKK